MACQKDSETEFLQSMIKNIKKKDDFTTSLFYRTKVYTHIRPPIIESSLVIL